MHTHSHYTEGCFTCKLKTLNFGTVPGAAKEQGQYDKQALEYVFGSNDEQARVLDETDGVGVLKRDKQGRPYKRNRTDGTYEQASLSDQDKVLFGRSEKASRTFGSKRRRDAGGGST